MTVCIALSGFVASGAGGAPPDVPRAPEKLSSVKLATVQGYNSVRAYRGVQAWTTWRKGWRIAVRRDGRVSTPVAIGRGDHHMKVDVGPGPGGNVVLAYVRCKTCPVVVSDLAGRQARTVPGSTGATSPTIWGSRVAWVRGDRTIVTSRLGVAGVTRLPAARRAIESIDDIELRGARLALIDTTTNWDTEVRVQPLDGGSSRLVARMYPGEDQQTWIGPSWAGGDLFFYKSCPMGCEGAAGVYRYDPDTGTHALAKRSRAISGFAMDEDGRHDFEVWGLFGDRREFVDVVTSLQLTGPLTFRPTRPPRW